MKELKKHYLCIMLSIQNISVEFAAKPLFSGVSFVVNKNDRIALVGKNGAGKSTLMKIIARIQSPSSGQVAYPDSVRICYLPQQMNPADSTTVKEEVRKAFSDVDKLHADYESVSAALAERTDYDSEEYAALINRLDILNERIALEAGDNGEAEIERTLLGLGFTRSDFDRATSEFSGGWRMRIELAKILLENPDVLLLDEPTNHLDIDSIRWLESFLIKRNKAVIVVSHDKAFIDNMTRRTIEISCGKIYDYKVNYSEFIKLRSERVEQQRRAYENQQKQIADIKDFIERFRYKATKSVQVQSRIKMLEKIVPIEIDEVDDSRLSLKFPPAQRSGDYPVIADGVGKAYGAHQVFSNVDLTVKRGEKVAFVGKNGAGKSTLVKCIMGELPFDGSLKIGHNTTIGYFAQNQAQLLDGELTVFETIDRVATGDIRTKIRDILGAFMFGGEASDKKVKVLSGGEKTRLAMIKLLLEPANLLILDEPTNHLDIKTKEILKDAVKAFDGTVIVVSHDRDFLNGLVTKVYEFADGNVREHLGGIYDYLEKRNLESLADLESGKNMMTAPQRSDSGEKDYATVASPKAARKLSYAESKEREKLLRKARKEVEAAEAEVARFDELLAAAEEKIAAGDTEAEILAEYERLKKESENAMSIWELASSNLEELSDEL